MFDRMFFSTFGASPCCPKHNSRNEMSPRPVRPRSYATPCLLSVSAAAPLLGEPGIAFASPQTVGRAADATLRSAQLLILPLPCTLENLSNWPPSFPPKGPCSIRSAVAAFQPWRAAVLDRIEMPPRSLGPKPEKLCGRRRPRRMPRPDAVQWPLVRGVLEEILTGEVLTRVWTAVLCLYDRQHGGNEFESLARSIMIGHLEARHRVLMLHGAGAGNQCRGRGEAQSSPPPRGTLDRSVGRAPGPLWRRGRIRHRHRSGGRVLAGSGVPNGPGQAGGRPGRCCRPRCGQPSNADWRR